MKDEMASANDAENNAVREQVLPLIRTMEVFLEQISYLWEVIYSPDVSRDILGDLREWIQDEGVTQTTGKYRWEKVEEECSEELLQALSETLFDVEAALRFLEGQRQPTTSVMEAAEELWNVCNQAGEADLRRRLGDLGRRFFTTLETSEEEARRLEEFKGLFPDHPTRDIGVLLAHLVDEGEANLEGEDFDGDRDHAEDEGEGAEEARPFPNPWN